MSRFSGSANIPAGGGRSGYFPREDATYLVAHKKSFLAQSKKKGTDYWLAEFLILESTSETTKAGMCRAQQMGFDKGTPEFVVGLAKQVALAYYDMDEEEFNEDSDSYLENLFPRDEENRPQSAEDIVLMRLQTSPGEGSKGQPITHHSWEPATSADYEKFAETAAEALGL